MAVINTGLLSRDLNSAFFERYNARNAQSRYQRLATRIGSTKDVEHYKWLGTVPPMREWGTGRLAKGLRTESYDVTNLKYEATLEVDRDEISDDQTGQIRIRVNELADRAAGHKDRLIAGLLNNGGSAGYLSYDGQIYFSASHSSGSSGSQDNDLAPTMAASTAPTSAECRAGVQAAIAAMESFLDDRGEPMDIQASGLVVVAPPLLALTMREALQSTILGGTTNVMAGVADVMSLTGLTSGVTAYLCKTDAAVRPFIFQDREPIEFASVAENSEEEFKREKYLYGVRARYAMTYGMWQHCVRMVFTYSG